MLQTWKVEERSCVLSGDTYRMKILGPEEHSPLETTLLYSYLILFLVFFLKKAVSQVKENII